MRAREVPDPLRAPSPVNAEQPLQNARKQCDKLTRRPRPSLGGPAGSDPEQGAGRASGSPAPGDAQVVGRLRASPGRSSAVPPSPAAPPRRGPSTAATRRPGVRRAIPSHGPSPVAAHGPRPAPPCLLPGAGRAPAKEACARPAPRPALRPPALPPPLRTCGCARLCPREPQAAFLHAPLTHPPPVHLACSSPGAKTRSSGVRVSPSSYTARGLRRPACPAPELTPALPFRTPDIDVEPELRVRRALAG